MSWKFDAVAEITHITNWIKKYFATNGPDSKAVIGISGGKDSTIAAALCVRALGPDRVFGVLMPQGVQEDIEDARQVCQVLGIKSCEINIGNTVQNLYHEIDRGYDFDHTVTNNSVVTTNTPARIRMATLYAVAAVVGGRVCNTCNRSEEYVGYSTKFGDNAGDFAPLADYTVRELKLIGDSLVNLPLNLVHKTPSDGMCGKSDEDNLGFTYEELDAFLLDNVYPPYEKYVLIQQKHKMNDHKRKAVTLPTCIRLSNTFSF